MLRNCGIDFSAITDEMIDQVSDDELNVDWDTFVFKAGGKGDWAEDAERKLNLTDDQRQRILCGKRRGGDVPESAGGRGDVAAGGATPIRSNEDEEPVEGEPAGEVAKFCEYVKETVEMIEEEAGVVDEGVRASAASLIAVCASPSTGHFTMHRAFYHKARNL